MRRRYFLRDYQVTGLALVIYQVGAYAAAYSHRQSKDRRIFSRKNRDSPGITMRSMRNSTSQKSLLPASS